MARKLENLSETKPGSGAETDRGNKTKNYYNSKKLNQLIKNVQICTIPSSSLFFYMLNETHCP
jgi:hypothetical protein